MSGMRKLINTEESMINILRSNGRSKHPEDVNLLEIFFNKFNVAPSIYKFESDDNDYYYWDKFYKNIKEIYPELKEYFKEKVYSINDENAHLKQQTLILRDNLILHLEGSLSKDMFLESNELQDSDNIITFSSLLCGDELSEDEVKKIINVFKSSIIDEKESITIGMVSFEDGSFYVKDFDIKDKIQELDLFDLHYGDGFDEFNNKLLERLLKDHKGLTLFHGEAGTGKTTYIRHLIKKIKLNDKNNNILYFPPTMVGSITEPGFINFISEWVSDSKGKNYLLIEDAEPLLESRNQSRNIGITNLLNLTDGILNDVLSIQIIATFNTNLQNIDSALLRPERLLARKEFKKLSKERITKLIEHLNIDEKNITDNNMSLADIYSLKKESKPLTHDIDISSKKLGF